MVMIYTSKRGKTIVFDNWEENENWKEDNLSPYWVDLCPHCHNKFKGILKNKICDWGSGVAACSVEGCKNMNAGYYADFNEDDVSFVEE